MTSEIVGYKRIRDLQENLGMQTHKHRKPSNTRDVPSKHDHISPIVITEVPAKMYTIDGSPSLEIRWDSKLNRNGIMDQRC